LIWLVGVLAVGIWPRRGRAERDEWQLALVFGWLALVVHFGLDIDASYPALLWLAAALAGLGWTNGLDARQRGGDRASARRRAVVPAALAAGMLVVAAGNYQSAIWVQRGQAAQDDGDYSAAADDLARAHAGLVYNPDVLTTEGIDHLALAAGGDREAANVALSLARAAARQDPDDAQHYYLQGRALALQGRMTAAEAALRRALALEPHSRPEYARSLVELLRSHNNLSEAAAVAQKMLAQYDDQTIRRRSTDSALRPALAMLAAELAAIDREAGNTAAAAKATARARAIYAGR